jgi:hypothetical protein
MRFVNTEPPSFPPAPTEVPLSAEYGVRWHVVCGDAGHWRGGLYSPEFGRARDVRELERHDCPELFVLLSGRVTLLVADGQGGTREVPLEPGKPVLVTAPHAGFCPNGAHTGVAFVVERDAFRTEYRDVDEWK